MHQSEEKKYISKMSLDQFLISKYNVRAMCFQFNYFEMLASHPYKTFPIFCCRIHQRNLRNTGLDCKRITLD